MINIRNMKNRPRYFFAHQVMRSVIFQGERMLGGIIANDIGKFEAMINSSWIFANNQFRKKCIPYEIETYTRIIQDNKLLVLFSTPAPKQMLDTYFCGFVIGERGARYFTVEKGMMYTILGEWTKEGGHINYGEVSNEAEKIIDKIDDIYEDVDIDEQMNLLLQQEDKKMALIEGE